MKRILAAALLAALATPAHSEEPPPPMQPRSSEAPASEDHGPMWIATTKAKCGPYQVVLWTGVATDDKPAPAPFTGVSTTKIYRQKRKHSLLSALRK
jgi:hypothetical protein